MNPYIFKEINQVSNLLKNEWITASEMESICVSCADTMRKSNIKKIRASYLVHAFGWDSLPPGWTKKSVKKYWNSLEGDHVHKVSDCIKKMTPHFGKDGAGGFCASINDMIEGDTDWRGKE